MVLKGKSKQEILISTYICHPSMANDELSGTIVSLSLIKYFQNFKNLSKTLRFIFIPETIGSIAFLHNNINELKSKIVAGYNITCIGDERSHSCIFSKYKNTQSDDALIKAYKKLKIKYKEYSFLKRVLMKDNLIHLELNYQLLPYLGLNMVSFQNITHH